MGLAGVHALTQRTWIAFALLSAAGFAAMATCVRLASETLPQSEIVFFRNFMALLFLLPMLLRRGTSLKTDHFGLHLFRALVGLSAMYLYFYALARLPLADAILLNYTSPLFIAFFAVVWLGESWGRHKRIATVLGLSGVALLFHPSTAIASLAGLVGLASGALAGLALTTVKRLSHTEDTARIVIWFALIATIISAIPMSWSFRMPDAGTWLWLIGLGIFGSMGQIGLARAYRLAPVSRVAPLGYATLLFAALIGFLLWQETPDALGLAGTLLIVLGGIVVTREQDEPAPQPPSAVPVVEKREMVEAD